MARPSDPELRPRLLEKIIDYVKENGVSDFSLRPLAAAIGTSHRTILYHFGSREQLLCTVFDAMRLAGTEEMGALLPTDGDPRRLFIAMWRHVASDEMRPVLRLFYEMYAIATRAPERFGNYASRTAGFWLENMSTRFQNSGETPHQSRLLAGMTIAMFRGATLELAATNEVERLTEIVLAFLDTLPLRRSAS